MQNLCAAHRQISASTIGQYRSMAAQYRDGTWNHDVSQNIQALLAAIAGIPPYRILDLGCGPGRDLVTFRDQVAELAHDRGAGLHRLRVAVQRQHVAAQEHVAVQVTLQRAEDRVLRAGQAGGHLVVELDLAAH